MAADSDLFLFVSHVAEDRTAALEVVDELERRGVRCWIAPRNVRPGSRFDDEISDALDNCRAMLLIFSENCNKSEYVHREVTVAGDSQKIIIPFRIEDAHPRRGLRVRLSDLHWIDGFASRERAIDELVSEFNGSRPGWVDHDQKGGRGRPTFRDDDPRRRSGETERREAVPQPPSTSRERRWKFIAAACVLAVMALVSIVAFYRQSTTKEVEVTVPGTPLPAAPSTHAVPAPEARLSPAPTTPTVPVAPLTAPPSSDICSPISVQPGFHFGGYVYKLSDEIYPAGTPINNAIKNKYGNETQLADWTDLKTILNNPTLERDFISATGIPLQSNDQSCNNILISSKSQEFIQSYHFLMAFHDGNVPQNWAVLDRIGGHILDLGRWNHPGHALIKVAENNP
jgi:hypothetical protein